MLPNDALEMSSALDQTDDAEPDGAGWADKPEEACGVFGVYAPGEAVAKLAYFGLYAIQHRGQESAGIATFEGIGGSTPVKVHLHKEMGLVSHVFNETILQQLPGELAIGHNRYSTTGSSRRVNAQPAVVATRLGQLALAHNGEYGSAAGGIARSRSRLGDHNRFGIDRLCHGRSRQ
jgi:amidophosphoribosyltransferase